MLRDPEESAGSVLGWLATMALIVGGLTLGFAAYVDPAPVVEVAALGGVDVGALADTLHLTVNQVLSSAAVLMVGIGAVLRGLTTHAHSRRRRHAARKRGDTDPEHRRKALRDPFRER